LFKVDRKNKRDNVVFLGEGLGIKDRVGKQEITRRIEI